MDLLSDLLLALRVHSTMIACWHMSAPWGVHVTDFKPALSINVVEGELWVASNNARPQHLVAGDSLLAPHGSSLALTSAPGQPTVSLEQAWGSNYPGFRQRHINGQMHWGGGGANTRLVTIAFQFHENSPLNLLDELPELIIVPGHATGLFPSTHPAFDLLMQSPGSPRPGDVAVATHLAELILISQLRAYVLTQPQSQTGWLLGLSDVKIGKALSAFHGGPAGQWSVASLARIAGMSRSSFAERFSQLVGRTPMEYVNDWRARIAAEAIRNSDQPMNLIAQQLGFESDRSFRRIFARHMGVSPMRYRQQKRASDAPVRN